MNIDSKATRKLPEMTTRQVRVAQKEAQLMNLQGDLKIQEEAFLKLSAENNINLKPDIIRKQHISHLKLYNELRDTGLRLAQLIAEEKQCKLKEVFDEMGYEMSDK